VQRDGVGGVAGLRGALAVAASPDGAHVYATGSSDHAVAVFGRNPLVGRLTFVQAQFDGGSGVDGLNGLVGTSAVVVSPDGGNVYTASATDSAVAVFRRNSATGALTFVEAQRDGVGGADGLNGAWGLAVSPDDAHVYVGSAFDRAVAAFRRNSATGALTFVEAQFNGVAGVGGLDDP
jgi:6-phosphogluconolactonase (cycloisomerase 2 family)